MSNDAINACICTCSAYVCHYKIHNFLRIPILSFILLKCKHLLNSSSAVSGAIYHINVKRYHFNFCKNYFPTIKKKVAPKRKKNDRSFSGLGQILFRTKNWRIQFQIINLSYSLISQPCNKIRQNIILHLSFEQLLLSNPILFLPFSKQLRFFFSHSIWHAFSSETTLP